MFIFSGDCIIKTALPEKGFSKKQLSLILIKFSVIIQHYVTLPNANVFSRNYRWQI